MMNKKVTITVELFDEMFVKSINHNITIRRGSTSLITATSPIRHTIDILSPIQSVMDWKINKYSIISIQMNMILTDLDVRWFGVKHVQMYKFPKRQIRGLSVDGFLFSY